ncbi:MAG: alanine--tRNA ligase, partial [Ignavibacteriales bacterium]|nr:alanine--tRNA ligase [Ignavibacteriales bacterium]
MTSSEIRNSFLEFFRSKQHAIVPSAPVVPYDDLTLLFTNAGMNQFKDVFLGAGKRDYSRAADTQKCIRVSGKHNDLEEVGRDTYHHTFFEMLGNWSFGDPSEPDGIGRAGYYKKEAIEWAWELLTKVWGLPKNRLWATVYKDDHEAEQWWKTVTDIDPLHVLRFGEKDNFWEMGETGPCGPCSEIHIDRTPNGSATADMVNAGLPELMEIWNLVFIQYNRDENGKLTPLPSKHVDTGLGFERVCAVLQGKNSNYDTDVFTPIIKRISEITKQPYNGSLQSTIGNRQLEIDISMRVIADHVRTLTFAIGDGALPSNEGRGYVLRRILRRAARFGRNLGMHEPFICQLVPTLVETTSYIFPEIKEKQEHIQRVIKGEEEGFNATLDNGLKVFEEVVKKVRSSQSTVISGEDAFKLYDTFGFPLDLTQLMTAERGLKVDVERFQTLMKEQRIRSREVRNETTSHRVFLQGEGKNLKPIGFVGYEQLEVDTEITSIVNDLNGNVVGVALENTPFYAESGGQIGDRGVIAVLNNDGTLEGSVYGVVDTFKNIQHVHVLKYADSDLSVGRRVRAKVMKETRISTERNHTATHLVHEALRQVLGTHLHQHGSLVAPDHLRFDFNHFEKVAPEQLREIEEIVNAKIVEGIQVVALNDAKDWLTIDEAKKRWPNVKMFFGEKYGERVRVVEVDPSFSVELCGGTHVKNTADIGYFKFRTEGSVAAGIRRIEAVTSERALELLKDRERTLNERIEYAFGQNEEVAALGRELGSSIAAAKNFQRRIETIQQLGKVAERVSSELDSFFAQQHSRDHQLESLILEITDTKKTLEKELSKARVKSAAGSIDAIVASATTANGVKLASAKVSAATMDELKTLGDTLRAKLGSGVGLLSAVIDD